MPRLPLLPPVRWQRGPFLLISLATLALPGCGTESPIDSPKAPSSSSAAVAPSSPEATAAAPSSTAAASAEATPSTLAAAAASSSGPAQNAAAGKSTAPAKKVPPAPSAAQIEKWGTPHDQPLQLLTCSDGFGDSYLRCLAVTPDGKRFVLGGVKLTVWNTTESQPATDLVAKYKDEKEVKRPILSVGIDPKGEWLAAGDNGGKLRFWNLSDLSEKKVVPAHEGRVTQIAISPDSKLLATTSYSGEVRLWNSADGAKVKSLKVDNQELARLAFLSDALLACAGRETTIWNVDTGERIQTLTTGRVIGPALGVSHDRHWLAFAEGDGQTKLWDIQKQAAGSLSLHGGGAHLIEFSHDGMWIATLSGDSIRIWNAATGNVVQVIDADGGRTVALQWLPESPALLVASESGRVRTWGTVESAKTLGIEPIRQPELRAIAADAKKSYSSAQFDRLFDGQSFHKLPNALPGWSYGGMDSYNAPASQAEAELFYRYFLDKAGWVESAVVDPASPGLNFRKQGCALNVSFAPADMPIPGRVSRAGDLQISLRFAGNYDVRWLPRISAVKSNASFDSFSMVMYRTKTALTDLEVAILKQFHDAGWTAYTRLAASSAEEPLSRSLSMLQGGSMLNVSLGYPADSTDELVVQTSVNVTNKSLPIPPDSGWIEFDNSTDLQMVANTKMDLTRTIEFYDAEMALDGWLAREAGRHLDEKEKKAWLPYIRGQQDVLIRLVSLPDEKTRVIVGNAEQSSWQLEKPRPANAAKEQAGIEAADFQLPKGAAAVKFDVDQKNIQFELTGVTPPQLAEQFVKQMEVLEWKRESAGVSSDEYVLVTYSKGKAEIQLRGRAAPGKSTAMISGDGLLWGKPLPTAAVRISYETWLRRNRKPASLGHLDEFTKEMQQIPAGNGNVK